MSKSTKKGLYEERPDLFLSLITALVGAVQLTLTVVEKQGSPSFVYWLLVFTGGVVLLTYRMMKQQGGWREGW